MSDTAQAALKVEKRDGIAIITLNRPEVVNAINDEIRKGLPAALRDADQDPAVQAIVLHGGEGRGFCAGADIKEARGAESQIAVHTRVGRDGWIKAFFATEKPIIAAIHGFCMGGGMEIALGCDIRIASKDAKFALPETGLGLIPGAGGTQRLARMIGLSRAMDMILTGERMSGEEAYRLGLVSRLVETPEEVLTEALAVAAKVASKAPVATRFAKQAVNKSLDLSLEDGLALEANLFALLSATQDKVEAAQAFKEKRAPKFIGT